MRKISIGLDWQGDLDIEGNIALAKSADDAGVHSFRVAEAWGRDAFTTLAVLARETSQIQLGTGIVNYFSRTPAALAQHFGTLDQLSGGRMFIGLGSSSPYVIEHFHGIKYERPLTRLREYVDIINMLLEGKRLKYEGRFYHLERGFTLRFHPVRPHIPIYVGAITPSSLKTTAEVADGILAMTMPIDQVPGYVKSLKEQVRAAGRDPDQFEVFSSGRSVTVTSDVERGYEQLATGLAFYIAQMGDFYYEHFVRIGMADEANAVRKAWREGGSQAGIAALTRDTLDRIGVVGSADECIDWLEREEEAGITIHAVSVDEPDPNKRVEIFKKLVG
jgi:alkanesulfonate monooxygenase SsuD/methylene tetrahydromethanopterin reductase-like flavin-dependent oxidoreductase (luciferase family)